MPEYHCHQRILREEWITITVTARSKREAARLAENQLQDTPYAEFEPGDVVSEGKIIVELARSEEPTS